MRPGSFLTCWTHARFDWDPGLRLRCTIRGAQKASWQEWNQMTVVRAFSDTKISLMEMSVSWNSCVALDVILAVLLLPDRGGQPVTA